MQAQKTQKPETMSQDRIRERAYAIWQDEGCPDGRAEQHWSAAEKEVQHDKTASSRKAASAPKPRTTGAAKPANGKGQPDARTPDDRKPRQRA